MCSVIFEFFIISFVGSHFGRDFETSNGLAAHPYSLNCCTVSVTVLGESKNPLVSKILILI